MPAEGGRAAGPIGAELPEGARFVGPTSGLAPAWRPGDAPTEDDLARCVACGLCLPHCPTYRLTGQEVASPRGRIAAMRLVAEGRAEVDRTFASFMEACLVCRACEDVCPSHVPFGRLMERARVQIEPLRPGRARFGRWLGLGVAIPRRRVLSLARALTPLARPFVGRRIRALVPRGVRAGPRVAAVTEPLGETRGTVALLTGCVQDQWFRQVNRATARVLAANGWRVVVPRGQTCCGALHAHNGRLDGARKLARRNLAAFAQADDVVVNAAGCSAHMRDYGDLLDTPEAHALSGRVRDLMAFLSEEGIRPPGAGLEGTAFEGPVAYHDACHALRAQGIREQPRALLRQIPGLEVVDIPEGDRCCGAAGIYGVTQPETSDELMRRKAEAVASTAARVVASANPGCSIQIAAGLRPLGADVRVVHPVELLDAAYARAGSRTPDAPATPA
ncbi:MAG: (Fe-S)-binding protein [Candidatus Velamenicoccus archaeovorus]